MKSIVVFDLDGTLIKGQSQRLFLNYVFKKRMIGSLPYARIISWFVLRKIGIAHHPRKTMEYGFRFLQGLDTSQFDRMIGDFFSKSLQHAFFRNAKELVQKHNNGRSEIMLVSNAIEPIVKKAGSHLGIKNCVGTKLEIKNNKLTGKIAGNIMLGFNKIHPIKSHVANNNLTLADSWAYSDHISDLPVMEMVSNPVAVNPERNLHRKAINRNWPVLMLKK
ncbi:MAG: HAD-superfamily hydrolase [Firmicutes bacterium]|nr:HAD-superfamily hydrolase [Bacillota bacterium]